MGDQTHRNAVPTLTEARYSQSLERGLAILGCFSPELPVLGIAELADKLGMARSTTHRYVTTLVALGYLEQGANRKYRLGLKVTDLGFVALRSQPLVEHLEPYLSELQKTSTYTVSVSQLQGIELIYLQRDHGERPGQREIDGDDELGLQQPAYYTAPGKLLLAALPGDTLDELLKSVGLSGKGPGPNSITSKKTLRAELEEIREAGYAFDDAESSPDVQALAVPIRDSTGSIVAALDLTAPIGLTTLAELYMHLMPELQVAALRISGRLGYRRPDQQ